MINPPDIVTALFSVTLTFLLYIFGQMFLDARRRVKEERDKPDAAIIILRATESEISLFSKTVASPQKEKLQALDYLKHDIPLQIRILEQKQAWLKTYGAKTKPGLRITYVLCGLLSAYSATSIFVSLPYSREIATTGLSIAVIFWIVVLAPAFIKVRQLNKEGKRLTQEIFKAFRLLGPELTINLHSLVKRTFESKKVISPDDIIRELEIMGIYADRSDVMRATFAYLFPTNESRMAALDKQLANVEGYSKLQPEDKSEILKAILPLIEIEEAQVKIDKPSQQT